MKKSAILMVLMSFFVSIASAEYIYMKSGEEVNGKIVAETHDSITVSVSGKKRKLMLKDIDEIASKKKETAPAAKAKSSDNANDVKVQFSSKSKQDMPDSQVYVADNKSGIIVYNVKETEKPKKDKKASAPAAGAAPEKAEVKAKSDDKEFDVALYLLSGGESGSTSVSKNTAESIQKEESSAAPAYVQGESPADDGEYDPVKYLLGQYGDDYYDTKEDPAEKPAKEKKAGKEKKQKAKKQAAASVSDDSDKVKAEKEKPDNETFLAVSFDLKGVHIVTGDSKDFGVKSSADKTENSDYGISISAEQYAYLSRFAAVGLGIGYEFNRCLEDSPGRFSFLPLYAAFKMRVFSREEYHFYAVAHLGYNFVIANSSYLGRTSAEGGAYYAGGVGAVYNRYVLQVLYSVNHASFSYGNSAINSRLDKDLMFSKVGFYVGYLF